MSAPPPVPSVAGPCTQIRQIRMKSQHSRYQLDFHPRLWFSNPGYRIYPDTGLDSAQEGEEWGRAETEAIEISQPLSSRVLLFAFPSVSSLGLIGKLLMCEASSFHSICRAVLCSFKGEKTHSTQKRDFPRHVRALGSSWHRAHDGGDHGLDCCL